MSSFRCILIGILFVGVASLFPLKGYSEVSTDRYRYREAIKLMKEGKYRSSSKALERLIEYYPLSPLVEDAQYYLGLSFLKAERYDEAIEQFNLYLTNFPYGKYRERALAGRETAFLLKSIRPKERFVALQIHNFSSKDYKEVERELEEIKKRGYNTIILRVFHNRGDSFYPFIKSRAPEGVYFQTTHAPVLGDILTPILKIARRKGLKVFAWMTTRYADYGLNRKDLKCKAYDFKSRGITYCRGLDLFNEEAVRHLESLYRDLARYPIDGILFQDDLALRHNEGFGKRASALFKRETGYTLDPELLYASVRPLVNGRYLVTYTDLFWKWASWKNRYLVRVAKRIMDGVREINPRVRFAINLTYETAYRPKEAVAWLSQSLEVAKEAGFDFYTIMAYHRQIQEELEMDLPQSLDVLSRITDYATKKIGLSWKVVLKLQIMDWKSKELIPASELKRVLKEVRGKGVSIALSPYKGYGYLQGIRVVHK